MRIPSEVFSVAIASSLKNTDPLPRKLSPELAAASDIAKLDLDEKKFRWLYNEDAMATEKTSEGIRMFHADAMKLEKFIAEKLGA